MAGDSTLIRQCKLIRRSSRAKPEDRAHLRRQLSLRRARRFHLGLHPDPSPSGAGFSKPVLAPTPAPRFEIHRALQARLSHRQPALFGRPRHHRLMDPAHGPSFIRRGGGARRNQSTRTQELRTHPTDSHERIPQLQQRALKLLRLYADAIRYHDHRFRPANLRSEVIRAGKYWFPA